MRIAILTDFERFDSGYSLCSVVKNQAIMLRRYGHDVTVFVSRECEDYERADISLYPAIPVLHEPFDYASAETLSPGHRDYAKRLAEFLQDELARFDVVFTHDWIHTGWHLPHSEALRMIRDATRGVAFLHWVHSIPTEGLNWWTMDRYGGNHAIIYPNETDRAVVADQFNTDMARVKIIPHIVDLRTRGAGWHEDTWAFIEEYSGVLQADFVEVYPASRDRLKRKGVHHLIALFAEIKRRGRSVCLVIADQLATGRRKPENIQRYQAQAEQAGLRVNEFIFTSEFMPWGRGVPEGNLCELQSLGNLFINPTFAESYGLTLPEAALVSGALPVLNSSLPMQREISGGYGLFLPFGSYCQKWEPSDVGSFYHEAVNLILARYRENDGLREKDFHRQHHNLDRIYRDHYEPIMAEVRILHAGQTKDLRA